MESKMFRIVPRMFRANSLALSSQILGLLQIYLLLRGTGAGSQSDAYFLFFTWGALPAQVLIYGLLYPMWLRGDTLSALGTRHIVGLSCILSCVAIALVGYIILRADRSYREFYFHLVLFCCIAVINSIAIALALSRAAHGSAVWISAISLPGSILACILLLFPNNSIGNKVSLLGIGLFVGSVVFILLILTKSPAVGIANSKSVPSGVGSRKSLVWFLIKSSSGYGAGALLQTCAIALPASSITILSVISKLVGGVTTVVTNTTLPKLIHRNSLDGSKAFGFARLVILGCLITSFVIVPTSLLVEKQYSSIIALSILWALSGSLSAVAQRVALRFLHPMQSLASILIAIIIPVIVIFFIPRSAYTLSLLIATYASLDFLVAFYLFAKLRKYGILWMSTAMSSLLLAVSLI